MICSKISRLSKIDLSIISYLQNNSKVDNHTKKDLLIDTENKDFDEVIYEDYIEYNPICSGLISFDENSLRLYLQTKYKRTFPFSLSIFTGHPESLRKTLLWWFHRFTDFDPSRIEIPSIDKLNVLQRSIIDRILDHKDKRPDQSKPPGRSTMIHVVNAGPGTGKTTAANMLAYTLRNEGVLLISYTNESIKENYKRFFEYPDVKKYVGLKKYKNNPINLITVDSLAARIIGDHSDKNFDETIQMASRQIDPLKFSHPTRVRIYNYVIIDECQDIDDLRGNFILTFCQKIGIKTLTLYGDPRQKIRANCGKWYSNLWESTFDFKKNGHSDTHFTPIHKVGFEDSYRFKNKLVVDLVNSISMARPGLHVALRSHLVEEKDVKSTFPPIQILTINRLYQILDKLLEDPSETACIIGPSIEADNKTTSIGRTIASIFKAKGKKLCFRTEGAFQPDSIPFLTIHSVKGREFDNVFIFGMNNYPASFSMIPLDEAMSLIFVAHSRAKKRIFYVDGSDIGNFSLPLNVEPKYVDTKIYEGSISQSFQELDDLNSQEMRHFMVKTLIDDHNFCKFLEENRYLVSSPEAHYEISDWKIKEKPKDLQEKRELLSSDQWGFIIGFDYQTQLTSYKEMFDFYFDDILKDNYIIHTEAKIIELTIKGVIINNRIRINNEEKSKLVLSKKISSEDIEIIKKSRNIYSPSTILWAYYKIYHNDCLIALEKLKEKIPDGEYLISSEMLTEAIKGGTAETSITFHEVMHGRSDYIDPDGNIYELKSSSISSKDYKSLLQVWLYNVMIGNKDKDHKEDRLVYIIDCQKGHLYEIVSEESVYRWRYILKSYFILRHHVDLVTARKNYYISYGNEEERTRINCLKIKDNSFTLDTEFFNKDIFEIAIVNITDPFKTIIDLMAPSSLEGMMFALDWLPDTMTEMYKSTIDRVRVKFTSLISKSKEIPKLGYYIASTDVDWCKNNSINKIDLGSEARKQAENYGSFIAGSFGPKLGELYTLLAPFPLEFQPHLTAHTALCDALMLYELIQLGLIAL